MISDRPCFLLLNHLATNDGGVETRSDCSNDTKSSYIGRTPRKVAFLGTTNTFPQRRSRFRKDERGVKTNPNYLDVRSSMTTTQALPY